LHCLIDRYHPVYCDGRPITVEGLPVGPHELRIVESAGAEPVVQAFEWTISE
jgi:hypothetical protein